MKLLIHTGPLRTKLNSMAVECFERAKCAACEFGNVNLRPDKIKATKKILHLIKISRKIIFFLERWCNKIIISYGKHVTSIK